MEDKIFSDYLNLQNDYSTYGVNVSLDYLIVAFLSYILQYI